LTGIAGIQEKARNDDVESMLESIEHRGRYGREIYHNNKATFGVVWAKHEENDIQEMKSKTSVWDTAGSCHFVRVDTVNGQVTMMRDKIGVVPLYYGKTEDMKLAFASEVKALLPLTRTVRVFPRGSYFDGKQCEQFEFIETKKKLSMTPEHIASELCNLLSESVKKCINNDKKIGAWLSGGLDSSIMSALGCRYSDSFHTFSVGIQDSEDVIAARKVAEYIESKHHETIVTLDEMIEVLPEVIYHLESFDALLVRSSIMNYIVSREASKYVDAVFSGEGADELFAGYEYLRSMDKENITSEVIDITKRLHNTALQRVDRSAAAHGITAYVRFLDPQVVDFALRIPSKYKVHKSIEKWILREAMRDYLPSEIVKRTKSKFWQGAGVGSTMARMADDSISDQEFRKERTLTNGWTLNTKEELLYYRIFEEHFGILNDLSWMGRTKGIPRN
jgi:asparagine synthase (glutamine-hydrolysing)